MCIRYSARLELDLAPCDRFPLVNVNEDAATLR
jgi:hypothetical protein